MNTPAPSTVAAPTTADASVAITANDVYETTAALDALRDRLTGSISLPHDAEWDQVRSAWNLAVDQRPVAVVRALNVHDVILTVNTARELGLRVAPQGTGHNAGALGDLSGTILLRTTAMRGVTVQPESAIARCESGALWMDVTAPAAEFGLAALAGSSPDVGIAGYCLGGGASWLARSHGLAVNLVTAIEIVTADGLLRRVDARHEPELFWAVRGGGGNFGVVTAIEMKLFPLAEVYAGVLFFPLAKATPVLNAWRKWSRTVPESVTSVGRIMKFPPLPELPDFLRGQSFVMVEAAMQLPADEADRLLEPLRELDPAIDTFHPTPVRELDKLHMDPDAPVPSAGNGLMLAELDAAAIDAFVAATASDPALMMAEIRHLGGAAGRPAAGGGVVSHFAAPYLVFSGGMVMGPEMAQAIHAGLARLAEALRPWTAAGMYQNFAEADCAPEAIWGEDLDRLRAIKVVYDPQNLIRANHEVL
ncbi:FAD-binding oxidoreductase [Rathayibacter sp. YIM 133350]|uniref:FAD-binding oxidoreductase n=1 Tax=Rathayibacter sp. YIM 133350 TaxID=3131992 RepID=UPI00307F1996